VVDANARGRASARLERVDRCAVISARTKERLGPKAHLSCVAEISPGTPSATHARSQLAVSACASTYLKRRLADIERQLSRARMWRRSRNGGKYHSALWFVPPRPWGTPTSARGVAPPAL